MFKNNKNQTNKVIKNLEQLRSNSKENIDIYNLLDSEAKQSYNNIISRIDNGRESLEYLLNSALNSVMQLSSLDLKLEFENSKISEVNLSIYNIAEKLNNMSKATLSSTKEVAKAHDEITESMTVLSEKLNVLSAHSNETESMLENMNSNTNKALNSSEHLQTDMNSLLNSINNMNTVIESIYSISEQTNLLALNASIEAARAGEAGKGFSVVANEIRKLAEQTKELTGDMTKFVSEVGGASKKSHSSVQNTVTSLTEVTNGIKNIIGSSKEDKTAIEIINEGLSCIVATNQQINASMQEVSESMDDVGINLESLYEYSRILEDAGKKFSGFLKPISNVEAILHSTIEKTSEIISDPFFEYDNKFFMESITTAIKAHKEWIDTLKEIIDSNKLLPIQTDSHKCSFGHFYYSMKPNHANIVPIWNGVKDKHTKFHEYGNIILDGIKSKDSNLVSGNFDKAKELSTDLINDFNTLLKIIEEIDRVGDNAFSSL